MSLPYNNFLIFTSTPPVWDDDNLQPANTIRHTDEYYTTAVHFDKPDPLPNYPAGAVIVGAFQRDGLQVGLSLDDNGLVQGTPSFTLDEALYEGLVPLKNPEGQASGILGVATAQGHGYRHLGTLVDVEPTSDFYADTKQPFVIKFVRTNITDDGFPHIPWGFQATLTFVDPNRQPDSYSIGIYSDAAALNFLWTPGAWIDVGGVWTLDCPVGQRTADRTDWHMANLLGSDKQGIYSLLADQDEFERQFWEESIFA